jgi:hypothetical protein
LALDLAELEEEAKADARGTSVSAYLSTSRSIPTSTARSVRSSSQSIKSSAKARLCGRPELADPIGSLEVGKHEDVEEFSAGSGTERVQALPPFSQAHPDACEPDYGVAGQRETAGGMPVGAVIHSSASRV